MNSEGSVFIATANDNAVGMYTCTAYNSYGTMGQSEPTKVILQVKLVFLTSVKEKTLSYECTQFYTWAEVKRLPPSSLPQDPPSFRVPPQPEYLQEVGRELIIPCEASGDPTPNVTWSKVQEILCSDR